MIQLYTHISISISYELTIHDASIIRNSPIIEKRER